MVWTGVAAESGWECESGGGEGVLWGRPGLDSGAHTWAWGRVDRLLSSPGLGMVEAG